MFDTTGIMTNTVLASALSGYGIDFMTGVFIRNMDARSISERGLAEALPISFAKPQFVT